MPSYFTSLRYVRQPESLLYSSLFIFTGLFCKLYLQASFAGLFLIKVTASFFDMKREVQQRQHLIRLSGVCARI